VHTTGVDLTGLLSVVSDHLYSTPLVVVRELVQNAHDSITRRQFEDVAFEVVGARIEVEVEGGASGGSDLGEDSASFLIVRDTGAGLTEDEIHRFLATIGSGYTGRLRGQIESGGGSDLIGLFGIGFLSAFVVASRVTVTTTSFSSPNLTYRYESETGHTYTVEPAPLAPVGTTVRLALKAQHVGLANPSRLRDALITYATLLKYPITVQGGLAVNSEPPPWRDSRTIPALERRQRELDFAARFEHTFEPIATMQVRPSAAESGEVGSDVQGLLWIQDGGTYGTSDNRNLSVFVRNMLLDDDARDLLPRWAGFVGGAIESKLLTPTASREDLQRDAVFEATQQRLQSALVEGMSTLARQEPDTWRRVLRRHNTALIGAALADDRLFELLADEVHVPSSEGEIALRDVIHRGTNRLHVTVGAGSGFEDMLLRAQKIPVAKGEFYGVLALARRYAQSRSVELVELGTDEANRQLFMEFEIDPMDRAWLAEHLADDDEQVVIAHFEPASVPVVAVPDRQAELKRLIEDDEADSRISMSALRLARMYTEKIEERPEVRLFVNMANPAITQLLAARREHRDGVIAALRLLRAVKALLTSSSQNRPSHDIAEALESVSATVSTLLKTSP
jgi:molecular chaperone HtpG